MSKPRLSEEGLKETLKHLVFGFSRVDDMKDLTREEIVKACANMEQVFDEVQKAREARK